MIRILLRPRQALSPRKGIKRIRPPTPFFTVDLRQVLEQIALLRLPLVT